MAYAWQADPELWRELAPLVRAAVPEDITGEAVLVGAGDTSVAFVIGDHVVRLPRHDHAVESQAREVCALPLLAEHLPLEVPRPRIINGAPALPAVSMHRRVPGRELTLDAWLALSRGQQIALAHGVGAFLHALHSVPVASVSSCGVEVTDPWEQAISVRDQARASLYGLLPPTTGSQIDRIVDRYQSTREAWSYRPAILHCDIGPAHVLYDPEQVALTGVIDFGDVVIGDPARDFIFLDEDWNAVFLELVLQAYALEPRERLLPRIRLSNLLNHIWWTLWIQGKNRDDLLLQGLEEIRRQADAFQITRE